MEPQRARVEPRCLSVDDARPEFEGHHCALQTVGIDGEKLDRTRPRTTDREGPVDSEEVDDLRALGKLYPGEDTATPLIASFGKDHRDTERPVGSGTSVDETCEIGADLRRPPGIRPDGSGIATGRDEEERKQEEERRRQVHRSEGARGRRHPPLATSRRPTSQP